MTDKIRQLCMEGVNPYACPSHPLCGCEALEKKEGTRSSGRKPGEREYRSHIIVHCDHFFIGGEYILTQESANKLNLMLAGRWALRCCLKCGSNIQRRLGDA